MGGEHKSGEVERLECGLNHFRDRKEAAIVAWLDLGEDGCSLGDQTQRGGREREGETMCFFLGH